MNRLGKNGTECFRVIINTETNPCIDYFTGLQVRCIEPVFGIVSSVALLRYVDVDRRAGAGKVQPCIGKYDARGIDGTTLGGLLVGALIAGNFKACSCRVCNTPCRDNAQ